MDNAWQTALSVKAIPTEIRSSSFVELSISSYQSNKNEGTITLEIGANNLDNAGFFREETEASLTLNIEEGYNNVSSNFAPLTLVNNNIVFEDSEVEKICVSNWDINGNNKLSYYEASLVTSTGEDLFSNIWESGDDIIRCKSFNEMVYFTNLKTIGKWAFLNTSLETIIFPNSITHIEESAFSGCNFQDIVIPNVVYIGESAFSNLVTKNIRIININVSIIDNYAFRDINCDNITIRRLC